MARFDAIDLSKLPAPAVVEQLDFEAYLAAFKTDFAARAAAAGWDYDVGDLESDPVVKVLEVAAYREMLLRGRVNDAARAVMLAKSVGADLDQLGALYKTARAAGETDERYRERVQEAPEALSTCGPTGAYVYHAKRVSPTIKSVAVLTTPGTGEVHVLPLVSAGNGLPSSEVLALVRAACSDDTVRPMTDIVVVRAPVVTNYAIVLAITVRSGEAPAAVIAAARAGVEAYGRERHRIGMPVYVNAIVAAATVGGVDNARVIAPAGDLIPARDEAFFCTGVTVTTA